VPHPFAFFAKEPALSEVEGVGAKLPETTVFVASVENPAHDNPMEKAHKPDLENPAPVLDDEDEETLAAIDEGIRDADAGHVAGCPILSRSLRKDGDDAAGDNRFRTLMTL
jgi:hypothetical protein